MPRPSPSVRPTLIAMGISAGIAAPDVARADRDIHTFSPGLTLSVTVGDKTAFGIGLDVRYTGLLKGSAAACSSQPAVGAGTFAQVTWLNFSAWRFAGGAHAGGEINDFFGVEGEFGWSYRTSYNADYPGGHGPHLGLSGLFFPTIDFSTRAMLPLPGSPMGPELTFGLGPRFPGPFGLPQACVVEGRPLRAGDSYLLAPLFAIPKIPGSGPDIARAPRMDSATREALARAWALAGSAECSSIPAFWALARDLKRAEAPPSLVARALTAARDEMRHTAVCCGLAGEYACAEILTSPPLAPPPVAGDRLSMLIRLAIESWQDGCLGEGAAAERARRSLRGATSARATAALRAIARDEQKHADLGWDIVSFCVAAGGNAVREAIAAAITMSEPAPIGERGAAYGDYDQATFTAHGRLPDAEAEMAGAQAWEEARAKGVALLSRRPASHREIEYADEPWRPRA